VTTTNVSAAPETPRIADSSETAVQEGATEAIGGNVSTIWRGWWTWTPGFGTHNLQLPWSVIGRDSTVVVTASEIGSDGFRFVGGAPFQVSSIAPGPGVVTFKINIGFDHPLPMRTDVLVFN
jgi:hypothetical protein